MKPSRAPRLLLPVAVGITFAATALRPERVPVQDGARLVDQLGCAACHAGIGGDAAAVRSAAPSLDGVGARYEPGFIFAYLLDPNDTRPSASRARMPNFHLTGGESAALAVYLETLRGSGNASNRLRASRGQARAFARAQRETEQATPAMGERIARALNCAACHDGIGSPRVDAAPLLHDAGRFRADWLREFLTAPHAVRPAGHLPGTGSRMPDFGLSPDEAGAIASYLRRDVRADPDGFVASELTPFTSDKARRYLRDRYSCLGCHQLDGEGGRIGPDLSNAGTRLTAAAIHQMITAPHEGAPGTVMPMLPMPPSRAALLTSFLTGQTGPTSASSYLSLVDYAPAAIPASAADGAVLYGRLCAACHGATGEGDGFNAAFLPVAPTRHADGVSMAVRRDDTLFDGIAVGGLMLDRSHRMPGFGELLSGAQIRSLVAYIRELCDCAAPAWSRDGGNR